MFPDVEAAVAEAVLAQCHGNLPEAVEALLSMTAAPTDTAAATATAAAAPRQGQGSLPAEAPPGGLVDISNDDETDAATMSDYQLASQHEAEDRLRQQQQQMLQDEMLARQLDQDEQLARDLQQQLIMEDEEDQRRMALIRQQHEQYPGFSRERARGAAHNDPRVHRPSQWGAEGPTRPPPEQQGGSGVGESIYNAGAAVASGVGSLFTWAVGSGDEAAARKRTDGDGPGGSRGPSGGDGVSSTRGIPLQEMMPMSRAPEPADDDGDESGGFGARRLQGRGGGANASSAYADAPPLPAELPAGLRDSGGETPEARVEGRIVQLDGVASNWSHSSSYSGGGEVRRRAPRQPATSTHDNDLL